MQALIRDPFYDILRDYPRLVIDYCLVRAEHPARLPSHREAVRFAMERLLEQDAEDRRRAGADPAVSAPWTYDIAKARSVPLDAAAFLQTPRLLRRDRYRGPVYDCPRPDVDKGEPIPYWYAFLEPPHGSGCTPEDFRRVNAALFPAGTEALEVLAWTTDWSDYFDDGHEWWGAACWSVYDPRLRRFAVLLASATD